MKKGDQHLETSARAAFEKKKKRHPYQLMLYLGMSGSALAFLCLMGGFLYSRPAQQAHLELPRFFVLSTLVLLLSSLVLQRTPVHFEHDRVHALRNSLSLTLSLAFLFVILQYLGWLELAKESVLLAGRASGAYVYVISGLHVVHCLGGILVLSAAYFKALRISKDPVRSLVYFSDPFQRMKLGLLVAYWHFMGAVWLAVFLFFLFAL